ncbi:glycosyltransferase family 9 protein [Flavobacterium crassostreae]|uniref:ADP-heptose--LPS heptosyltransferase n=1 Tax=Flavobacterium crassostreae TaxID=1763534 RepID=A0A1B9E9T9_9FLAO|nr:glycosyltransferase family 9 protein [Flavobacterium crassostreae]OCB78706.1 ADP-heptose--LPS heptosyltransferase [Flavobacterium crassostreae]
MKKVLIIQNKRIGDVLISSVIANNFKAKHPDSEIHFMAYDFTHGVLVNNPNIDKIISINDQELKKIDVLFKTIRAVRKEKYDIIFDPYSKTQSRLICKFSGAKQTIGHKSRKKLGNLGYYTNPVAIAKEKTKICGKAIEDRIHLLQQAGSFESIDYEPKIFLTTKEQTQNYLGEHANQKIVVLGILGSTPQKSMPYAYVAQMADFITSNYEVKVLFNYAPNQKQEAQKIYALCKNKSNILLDIYAKNIRDFIQIMNQCTALVANEGGTVHIAKALNKPTFTIFSPYVNKDHWASFEDGIKHHSVHLLEMKPNLFADFTFEERKKIEKNPEELYLQLTPEMILPELDRFLKNTI